MSDIIIKAENVGKKYVIAHETKESYTALRDVISRKAKRIFSKSASPKNKEEFWALKDVSFEIKRGTAVGIIGRNGAGKSTLLKVLSRITEPTTGRIGINGRIASLLEVGTGFHPELTGRENIFLNGAILGMSRNEIRKRFDEIVDFSGVGKFLDTPVKRYSSGMYVRLAFSVAAHLEPEILVVDEVLAVGDAEFQKKCLGKMEEVSKNHGRTVLLVSHNLGSIAQLCSSAILLQQGQLLMQDNVQSTIDRYLQSAASISNAVQRPDDMAKEIYLKSVSLANNEGIESYEFRYDEDINIKMRIAKANIKNDLSQYKILVTVLDATKRKISSAETNLTGSEVNLKIKAKFLTRGQYSISTIIYIPAIAQYDVIEDCCSFILVDTGSEFYHLETFNYGVVFGNFSWE